MAWLPFCGLPAEKTPDLDQIAQLENVDATDEGFNLLMGSFNAVN